MLPSPSHLVVYFHQGHIVTQVDKPQLHFGHGERYALEFELACECVSAGVAVIDADQAGHNALTKHEIAALNEDLQPVADAVEDTVQEGV